MAALTRNVLQLLPKRSASVSVSNVACFHAAPVLSCAAPLRKVTLLPGDGVGPELCQHVKDVVKHTGAPIEFEEFWFSECNPINSASVEQVTASFNTNKVGLKGIIAVPSSSSHSDSSNMRLRKSIDLFANVVRVNSLPGLKTRHGHLDFVVIREQTEGEYSALEHESVPGVVESLKIITRAKSERIAKFAFDYAVRNGRKKVTAVHKANIMKLADGQFLQCCKDVSKNYPNIEFEAMIIDNCCMQLVSNPYQFDVMVMPNLYGNIVDNVSAGLVGGAGVVPGESYSSEVAVFEPGARHAFAGAVGKDHANPTAMLLAASNMLRHMQLHRYADVITKAVHTVIKNGKVRTKDVGGYASSTEFTHAIINSIK